ncbi:MAG: YlxR family protein [Acidimicrobiales bacterium]
MGCRRVAAADELVRVVARSGQLAVGRALPGRGAWLCRQSPACVVAAERRRAFSRALRTEVAPDEVERLHSMLADRARMVGE